MTDDCISFIKGKLSEIGMAQIYEDEGSEDVFKGGSYVSIIRQAEQPLAYDGGKVGKSDDFESGECTYHIRVYECKLSLLVRFADVSEAAAERYRADFLRILGTGFADSRNYRVAVEGTQAGAVIDKSILGTGFLKDVVVTFTGGVYRQKVVKLFADVAPEAQIILPNREE